MLILVFASTEEYFLFKLKLAKLYLKNTSNSMYFNTEAKSAEKIKLKTLVISVSIVKSQSDYTLFIFIGYLFRFQNVYKDTEGTAGYYGMGIVSYE